MLKALAVVAMFLIPGSSVVGLFVLARKLYTRYVHSDMEAERDGLQA